MRHHDRGRCLDRFTVDDIGAVVVGERTDRDLDLTDGKHRDVGGVAVETADLLTVDVQVQMALAIDMVAVDIRRRASCRRP